MKKYVCEFIGTAVLVLFGCGSAAIAGGTLGTLGAIGGTIIMTGGVALPAVIAYGAGCTLIGAGVGQGVGLVLSKVGMEYYSAALPADAPKLVGDMLPFASTMIRAIIGGIGFFILLTLQKGLGNLKSALHDGKGLKYATLLTIFGPALGVSLSLMAVRFADAGIASTLMALTPVFIILPDALINKHPVKIKEIIGVTVAMLGVAMFFLI